MKDQIQMVDLRGQHSHIQDELDRAIRSVMDSSAFINGPQVGQLQDALCRYLGTRHCITCASGTDALQLALMSLDLQPGDEVITPSFTFIATAEAIALLGLRPVMVDVCPDTFTLDSQRLAEAIGPHTRAVIVVNLFGQAADYSAILPIIEAHNLVLIEDNAQAFGAEYSFAGKTKKLGTIGHIGCTSFFPSKNLGCCGDGGAVFTDDAKRAERIRMLANHGAQAKYYHTLVGINSRLDTLQAAILLVKLQHIDRYNLARQQAAERYRSQLQHPDIILPALQSQSDHVYHQFTIRMTNSLNTDIQKHLAEKGIPSMIYYPVPLHHQEALTPYSQTTDCPVSELLATQVLSLPMHTELTTEQIDYISETLISLLNKPIG